MYNGNIINNNQEYFLCLWSNWNQQDNVPPNLKLRQAKILEQVNPKLRSWIHTLRKYLFGKIKLWKIWSPSQDYPPLLED